MLEMTRSQRELPQVGSGSDPFGDADNNATPATATVAHWPYAESLPVGGMTVGQVRRRYADRFDIDGNAQATLDGNEAGDDEIVRPGMLLRFVHRAGEKGAGREPAVFDGLFFRG